MASRIPRIHYWRTDTDKLWRFALVAGNGEPQAGGEGYKTEGGVLRGIAAARRGWALAQIKRVDVAPSRR